MRSTDSSAQSRNPIDWSSPAQLGDALKRRYEQRYTGTFIGVTRRHEPLICTLRDGVVIGLSINTVYGAEALRALRNVEACRGSFADNVVMRIDADLPPTEQIVRSLRVVRVRPKIN